MNKNKDNLQITKDDIKLFYLIRLSQKWKLITIWNFLNRLISIQIKRENIKEAQSYNDELFLKYRIERKVK